MCRHLKLLAVIRFVELSGQGMKKLKELPNIGDTLQSKLESVGIDSEEKLRKIGSLDAFLRMRKKGVASCVNTLYALEGAIKNMRWHNLSWESRKYLKQELEKFSNEKS